MGEEETPNEGRRIEHEGQSPSLAPGRRPEALPGRIARLVFTGTGPFSVGVEWDGRPHSTEEAGTLEQLRTQPPGRRYVPEEQLVAAQARIAELEEHIHRITVTEPAALLASGRILTEMEETLCRRLLAVETELLQIKGGAAEEGPRQIRRFVEEQ